MGGQLSTKIGGMFRIVASAGPYILTAMEHTESSGVNDFRDQRIEVEVGDCSAAATPTHVITLCRDNLVTTIGCCGLLGGGGKDQVAGVDFQVQHKLLAIHHVARHLTQPHHELVGK